MTLFQNIAKCTMEPRFECFWEAPLHREHLVYVGLAQQCDMLKQLEVNFAIFVGPESDHCLPLSLTGSLTQLRFGQKADLLFRL